MNKRKKRKILCGVYMIRSEKEPTKYYIGSSCNLRERMFAHIEALSKNKSKHLRLQNHSNRLGISDLHFYILELCKKDNLIEVEQYYISELNPYFNDFKFASFHHNLVNPKNIALKDIYDYNIKNEVKYFTDYSYKGTAVSLIKIEKDLRTLCDRDVFPDVIHFN